MMLIVKQKGGHQAISIKAGVQWDFLKVLPGRTEVRIVLRVRGRRYLLYTTRELSKKYPSLRRTQLMLMCDEIIAMVSERITRGQEYINFDHIAGSVELRYRRHWCEQGLIPLDTMEEYHAHPIDPKTEVLVSRARVDQPQIIEMGTESPCDEAEQEDLPN